MKSQIEEKRCELCNKPYDYKYKIILETRKIIY